MRRADSKLASKFVDPTRLSTTPPLAYKKVVVFFEKDTIRTFLAPLTTKYRLSTLTLRGYGSLTAFKKALARCMARDTKLVLYVGDLDCSGLDIERAALKEMDSGSGIQFIRLAVTLEQAIKYRLPWRRVNRKDPRAKEFLKIYGDRCWEFEAFVPYTTRKVIEAGFKKYLPPEFLEATKMKELATRAGLSITERFRRKVYHESLKLAKKGLTTLEIQRELKKKFG